MSLQLGCRGNRLFPELYLVYTLSQNLSCKLVMKVYILFLKELDLILLLASENGRALRRIHEGRQLWRDILLMEYSKFLNT